MWHIWVLPSHSTIAKTCTWFDTWHSVFPEYLWQKTLRLSFKQPPAPFSQAFLIRRSQSASSQSFVVALLLWSPRLLHPARVGLPAPLRLAACFQHEPLCIEDRRHRQQFPPSLARTG